MASTLTKKKSQQKRAAPRPKRRRRTSSSASDEHLKELMKQAVREVLAETYLTESATDPDAGLELRPEIIAELEAQNQRVAAGERGQPLAEVTKELHLE